MGEMPVAWPAMARRFRTPPRQPETLRRYFGNREKTVQNYRPHRCDSQSAGLNFLGVGAFEDIVAHLRKITWRGDLLVVMCAGPVWQVAHRFMGRSSSEWAVCRAVKYAEPRTDSILVR